MFNDLKFSFRQLAKSPGFTAVAVLTLAVALFACWVPAQRATRVNPVEALRAE